MKNLQKVKSVQRYFYKKTVKFTWNNGFLKLVFSGFIAIQNLKIIFLAYAGRVFVHLTEKNKSFERFKYFRYFRVSVLSYRANSKRRKWRKMYKTSFQWHISECHDYMIKQNWSFRWKITKKLNLVRELFSRKQ